MSGEVFLDGRVTLHVGDVRAKLRELPADYFDCVVTSPPYWGLRDYGTGRWEGGDANCYHLNGSLVSSKSTLRSDGRAHTGPYAGEKAVVAGMPFKGARGKCGAVRTDNQIGLEPTLAEHVGVMVDVFREVKRTLKPTGVCWINYGDCYATPPNGRSAADTKAAGNDDRTFRDKPFSTIQGTLKAKDLCMVPERLFIALQDDGWWIRSKMPWIKRNGMPESITDRPANSLEQVAMLTKSERYWYDADAVRKPASASTNSRVAQDVASQAGSVRANGGAKTNGTMKAVVRKPGVTPKSAGEDTNIRAKASWHESVAGPPLNDRNFRNTDLFFSSIEIPFGLISDGDGTPLAIDANPQGFSEAHFATFPQALIEPLVKAGCPFGGELLDPFGGSGTSALVAALLGRKATIIELNPEYAILARARIEAAFMGRDEGARHMSKQLGKDKKPFEVGSLFAGIEEKTA